ncbi:MAG: exodeoxyribonuclease VII small subunit [Geodermatophilaceae bacterium]|nr:exodeoxyribonuclease VII small subunit [Geodermatophilaceae bacterium]
MSSPGQNGASDTGDPGLTGDRPEAGTQSYEQARDELAQVVTALETGGLSLEESLALWERGEDLAAHCQGLLDGARARLDARLDPPD